MTKQQKRLQKILNICDENDCQLIDVVDINNRYVEDVVVRFKCKCGNLDEKIYKNFSRYPRCTMCGQSNCGNKKRFSIGKIREAFEVRNCTLLGDEYINAHQKLKYKCNICGKVHTTTWNNFTKIKSLCLDCFNSYDGCQKMSIEKLKNKLKEMGMELYSESFEYISRTKTKLPMKCQRCGKLQYRSFAILYKNKKCVCKDCEKTNLHTLEVAQKIIFEKYEVKLLSYNGFRKNCIYKCNCGHINEINYSTLFNHGLWCPYCMMTRSKGEELVKRWLIENNIDFKYEKTFDGLKNIGKLKIDFFLEDYDVAIEVDGEHHRSPVMYGGKDELDMVKKRDSIKNKYCRDNNIILIRIPYYSDNVKEFGVRALKILEKIKKTVM